MDSAEDARNSRHIFQHTQSGEQNAQHRRGDNADQNRLASLRLRQASGSKTDDDGVIASEHEVDQNDLQKYVQDIWAEKFKHGSGSLSCRGNGPLSALVFWHSHVGNGFTDTCSNPVRDTKTGHSNLTPVRHRSLLAARGLAW